jgi:hypothetical protein
LSLRPRVRRLTDRFDSPNSQNVTVQIYREKDPRREEFPPRCVSLLNLFQLTAFSIVLLAKIFFVGSVEFFICFLIWFVVLTG